MFISNTDNYYLKSFLILLIGLITSSFFGQNIENNQEQLIKDGLTFKPLQYIIPVAIKAQISEYYDLNKVGVFLTSLEVESKAVLLISDSRINPS